MLPSSVEKKKRKKRYFFCQILAYHSRMLWSLFWPMNKRRRGNGYIELLTRGITGLDAPPKFFRNPQHWTSDQPPSSLFFPASIWHIFFSSRQRGGGQSEFPVKESVMLPLHLCSPFSAIPISFNCKKKKKKKEILWTVSTIVLHVCSLVWGSTHSGSTSFSPVPSE